MLFADEPRSYGATLFQGTAPFYSRYRPRPPGSLIRFLIHAFSLDGGGRLLDLGCGPGVLALRLADWFEEIFGMDPEPEMLAEAARLAAAARIGNARWTVGGSATLPREPGPFRLVTIASAFHWMDRAATLRALYRTVEHCGGVAIVDTRSVGKAPWKSRVQRVLQNYLGEERRAGDTIYAHRSIGHFEIAAASPFAYVEHHILTPFEHVWTRDSLLGHLYSTSFASQRLLGDRVLAFEADFRKVMLDVDPEDRYVERFETSVILATNSR